MYIWGKFTDMDIYSFIKRIQQHAHLEIDQDTIFKILKAFIEELNRQVRSKGEINIENLDYFIKFTPRLDAKGVVIEKVHEPELLYQKSAETEKKYSSMANSDEQTEFINDIDTLIDKQRIVSSLSDSLSSKELFSTLLDITGLPIHFLADDVFEVTPKTFSRYKNEDRKVPALLSELAMKIIGLYKLGAELFGSKEAFNNWLMESSSTMNDIKPITYLNTSTGVDLLIEELKRIEFGATA